MDRRRLLWLMFGVAGCASEAERQAAVLSPPIQAAAVRARQSRRFDTTDIASLLQASVGVLQDMGYTISESQAGIGVVVGVKSAPSRIRAQIVVAPSQLPGSVVVRSVFQDVDARRALDDAMLYRQFYDLLEQSAFLVAHGI